ncbi:MAG: restriction endonuclease subunit S [Alphaproteobacteria bacterium]|nr:restriction endonuclease subunit S [Alphaproteobacteria bacterium]
MTKWIETALGDVVEIIGGGTPKTSISSYWNGNIPWLSVVDFNNTTRNVSKTEKTITEEGFKNSSTQLLSKGDIIISARGTVGALAQVSKKMAFNQSCYGLRSTEKVDQSFLYYLVKDSIQTIKKNTHGAVFDTITRDTFDRIYVQIPEDIEEQARIAGVLSCLDDKIELLQAQNKTLEDLAQTIFTETFLTHPHPDWKQGKLGDLMPVKTGKRNANHAKPNGKYKFFTCSQGNFLCDEYSFNQKAVLLSGNGDFSVKIYEGKFDAYQRTYVLTPYNEEWLFPVYFTLQKELRNLTMGSRGSVISFLTKGQIENIKTVVPDNGTMQVFNAQVAPMFDKISANIKQIATLTETRDTLLPKLITGKIKVKK